MMHVLKIWPENFKAIKAGQKPYEVRRADRPFAVGDSVELREWDPAWEEYSGQSMIVQITHLTKPGSWGLPDDLCVFAIQ